MADVKRTVSSHLMDIVIRQHGLLNHLSAIKRFLLLGQGDFVRVLLDSAQPELDKSAKDVSQYTLQVGAPLGMQGSLSVTHTPPASGTRGHPIGFMMWRLQGYLDAALRSSSAASEDADILRRVDVRLPSKPLEGDLGWDTFTLQYQVDGPLGAVLSPDAMAGGPARFRARLRTTACVIVLWPARGLHASADLASGCLQPYARVSQTNVTPWCRLPLHLPAAVGHQARGGGAGAVLGHHQRHAPPAQHAEGAGAGARSGGRQR